MIGAHLSLQLDLRWSKRQYIQTTPVKQEATPIVHSALKGAQPLAARTVCIAHRKTQVIMREMGAAKHNRQLSLGFNSRSAEHREN
jgi:hypothetical protein